MRKKVFISQIEEIYDVFVAKNRQKLKRLATAEQKKLDEEENL